MKLQTEPILVPGNQLGIKLDFPEQFLDKAMSPYSRNLEYLNGVLAGRGGLTKFDTTQLKGQVMLMEMYNTFTPSSYFMVCTNKDIMYYDFTNTYFVYLNKLYQTGQIYMGTGANSLVVFGSGTSWVGEATAGDYFKLGTGSINSDANWYEVATVNTAQITLLTAPTGSTYQGYTIRKCFQGQTGQVTGDYWYSTVFQDVTLGETWVATNGVDVPVRWTGSGQVIDVDTSSGMTAAKFVGQFKDRLLWAWTIEGGQNQPQRLRWSAVANIGTNSASDFIDFIENQAEITGLTEFSNYLAVMKEEQARIGRYVGGTDIFDFEISTIPVGCVAPNSIINNGDDIYYYGNDSKFHRWNFLREEDVSVDLLPWTKDFDPNMDMFIFGYTVASKNQIRWFVPHGSTSYHNHVVVYDYEQDIIEIWDTAQAQALSCMGEYLRVADRYFDDTIYGEGYFDDQTDYFDDQGSLDAGGMLVYGSYDGYIREADSGTDDDGENYTRDFKTKRLDFRSPMFEKRLWKQEWVFNAETPGSVSPTNELTNGDFETWTSGTNAAPDGWTLEGSGASVAREASIIKLGVYSAKVTRVTNDCSIYQTIHTTKGITYWKSRKVTFGCWVYATVASRARLIVVDGIAGDVYSSYHTGDSTWQWLSATKTINSSAAIVGLYCLVDTGNTFAYFDGAICVEGDDIFAVTTVPRTVTLTMKKGDNTNDEAEIKTIDLTSSTKDVIRPEVTWDKSDYTFQFELKSTNHFELIGFLNHWFQKGKTFR